MVAADLAVLEMRADEAPVQEQRSRAPRRATAHGAAASQHITSAATQFAARIATSIVHAQFGPNSTGFACDPRAQLRADLVEVARFAGQPVRGRQQRQVLEARQLPRDLDVRAVAEHDRHLRDVHAGQRRPVLKSACQSISAPSSTGPEPSRSKRWRQIASARASSAARSSSRRGRRAGSPARDGGQRRAGRARAAPRPRRRRRARARSSARRRRAAARPAAARGGRRTRATRIAGARRGARARHRPQPPPRREAFAQPRTSHAARARRPSSRARR